MAGSVAAALRQSNLAQRALTAVVGVTIALAAVWVGDWAFALLVGAAALVAQAEAYNLLRAAGTDPLVAPGLALGALAVLRPVLPLADVWLALGVLVVLGVVLFTREATPLLDAAATLFGVVYPSALAGAALALRSSEAPWLAAGGATAAFWLTTAAFVCVWGADTFAYFAGRALGRHPLFPRVSPKKTWEGSAGGALGALALAAGFKLAVPALPLSWLDVVALGVACGVASQLGDLVESLFKRSVDVKDSGAWLPGHGGMLDRLDAALVALPLVAVWFALTRGL